MNPNDFANWFWGSVDQILIELGLQVTPQNELALGIGILIAAIITIGFLAWLSFHLFWPSPRYGGRSPEDVEDEDESGKVQIQELGVPELPPFEPALRGRWRLFKNEVYMEEGGKFPKEEDEDEDKGPAQLGYIAEVEWGHHLFLVGNKYKDDEGEEKDFWLHFEGPEEIEETPRVYLVQKLKSFLPPDDEEVSFHNWGKILPKLRTYGIPEGVEFEWGTTSWRVEEFMGPYRVDVEGNTFAQGREIATLIILSQEEEGGVFSDELHLLMVIEYTGGRDRMSGKIYLWESGVETTMEEVSEWKDRKVKLSDRVRHAALKH